MIVGTVGPPAVTPSHRAPPIDQIPAVPASWYLFGTSREVRRGPVSKQMIGRSLVGFRTESGTAAVLDARCSHLGADLGEGCVVGETIECPFHGWRYGTDGCAGYIPGGTEPPAFARQASYPTIERHGLLFFFNGRSPLFPLPFFAGCDPQHYVPGSPFQIAGDAPWFMLASNGFDGTHFAKVHDRQLLRPPTVDRPAPFACRFSYSAQVSGRSVADRFIRTCLGPTVDVTITNWGGSVTLVTADFQRARSLILMVTRPAGPSQSMLDIVVFAPRRSSLPGRLSQQFNLRVRSWLTWQFLRKDFDRLAGIRYSPNSLIEADQDLIDFFHWLAALPQSMPSRQEGVAVEDLSNAIHLPQTNVASSPANHFNQSS